LFIEVPVEEEEDDELSSREFDEIVPNDENERSKNEGEFDEDETDIEVS